MSVQDTVKQSAAYAVAIWVAGDADDARRLCRQYCMEIGLCVTVTDCDFIYTGGQESGVRIGLLNYPRFDEGADVIWRKAEDLAHRLRAGLCQHSVLIQDDNKAVWLSCRREDRGA